LVSLWETKTFDFWQNVHRRERSYLGRAPDCFLAALPPPRQLWFEGGGGGAGHENSRGKGKTPPGMTTSNQMQEAASPKDTVARASKPILRWKDSVPAGSNRVLLLPVPVPTLLVSIIYHFVFCLDEIFHPSYEFFHPS
jgi:hypothetical protein